MIQLRTTAPYQEMITGMETDQVSAIVGRALGQTVTAANWEAAPLGDIDFSIQVGSGGVYRVWGSAITASDHQRAWSLVVKILKSPAGCIMPNGLRISEEMAEDRSTFGYWRREALIAQSDLLEDLPPGLAAPEYVAVIDRGDMIWLWQEEITGDKTWSWPDYREAAYRLGSWQGAYAAGKRPLPDEPWLTKGWLRQWVNLPLTSIMAMIEDMHGWHQPIITAYFAPEEVEQLQKLWADRQAYLDILAKLPQTWCHLDAYRSNLFWHDNKLRLIDWSFSGMGAVGEELAAFVGATLLLDHIPVSEAEQLEAVALEGYLAGLASAGWPGDPANIVLAYRCALPLRYALMSLAGMLRTAVDPAYAQEWAGRMGKPLADVLQHRADLLRFLISRRQEMAVGRAQ